jgi:hypothetical protein
LHDQGIRATLTRFFAGTFHGRFDTPAMEKRAARLSLDEAHHNKLLWHLALTQIHVHMAGLTGLCWRGNGGHADRLNAAAPGKA